MPHHRARFTPARPVGKSFVVSSRSPRSGKRVGDMLVPFAPAIKVLVSIPGIERRTAEVVVAEIGADRASFN